MTNRDMMIKEWLKEWKVARTGTIAALFFTSVDFCRRRLKILYDLKQVNRIKEIETGDYLYYISKPQQLTHSLLLTDFYGELSKIVKIEKAECTPNVAGVIPDAAIGYKIGDKKIIAFVEIELSNKGFDIFKYEKLYNSGDYKKYKLQAFPVIIAVTDKKILPTNLKLIQIKEDLSDIKKLTPI